MRRKDREMDKDFAYEVIDKSEYGTLCVFDYDIFAFPFSAVREGDYIYFHSATTGTKVEAFKNQEMVKAVFVADVKVPDLYTDSEIEEKLKTEHPSFLTKKIYTTEYASAICDGRIELVEDEEEKRHGLKLLCEKYTPNKMKFFDHATKRLDFVNVYKIHMTNVTAKRKKFAEDKTELGSNIIR